MGSSFLQRVGQWFSLFSWNRDGKATALTDVNTTMIPGDATGALSSSAVWACCRLVSQAISALPAHVFDQTPDGKIKATKHPLYRMLTIQPNPVMTLVQWLQTSVLHLMLFGNAYTVPEYLDGEVIALWPIHPDRVTFSIQAKGVYNYRVTDPYGGPARTFGPMELLHFRLFSLDGILGLSPVDYQRATFSMEDASKVYALNLYANSGRPSGVLEYPNNLTPEQVKDIRDSWKQVHAGPQNVGNIVVLEGGTKYAQLAIPPEQLEFIQQQKFSVEQIARIYGVPPHLIGAMDKPTYASVEQQAMEFVQYTLQPIVTSMEKTIQTVLLDGNYFYKLNLAAFERSDIKTRYAAYATGRQWGWLSVNDIRELEDQNRIPEGDIYLQPLNMTTAAAAQETINDGNSIPV